MMRWPINICRLLNSTYLSHLLINFCSSLLSMTTLLQLGVYSHLLRRNKMECCCLKLASMWLSLEKAYHSISKISHKKECLDHEVVGGNTAKLLWGDTLARCVVSYLSVKGSLYLRNQKGAAIKAPPPNPFWNLS